MLGVDDEEVLNDEAGTPRMMIAPRFRRFKVVPQSTRILARKFRGSKEMEDF
jgi:hypothetical protein